MRGLYFLLVVLLNISPLFVADAWANASEPWQGAYSAEAFAGGVIRNTYCDMVGLVEGSFGGLLAAAAGIMAFGFAAFGNSKHVFTALMVVGAAFTMSAGISLYFGDLGCSNSGGASGVNGFTGDVNPGGGAGLARTKLYDGSSSTTPSAEVSRFNVEKSVKSYLEKSSSPKGADSGADSSLESYADYYQDDSDLELF